MAFRPLSPPPAQRLPRAPLKRPARRKLAAAARAPRLAIPRLAIPRLAIPHLAIRRHTLSHLAIVGLLAVLPVTMARAQDGEEASVVTSDSASYCLELADEIGARADASKRALELGSQGRELCAQGHIRAGIFRVRRAWVMLRQADPPR